MTHIKITAKHTGDERWVDAGADAWTVHCWALTYCDQQENDGRLSRAMAERIALPVPIDQVSSAVDVLIKLGLWDELGDDVQIVDYDTHGLLSPELKQTRERWAADKRIKRKHENGVHDECTARRKCPVAIRESAVDTNTDRQADTAADSRRTPQGVSPLYPTRPDPTRPEGRGRGGGRGAQAGSASAPPDLAPHEWAYAPGADEDRVVINDEPCHDCGLRADHIAHAACPFEPEPDRPDHCADCGHRVNHRIHTSYVDYLAALEEGRPWDPGHE